MAPHSVSTPGKEDFFQYRDVLEWFHYQCYLNIGNVAQYNREVEKILDDDQATAENMHALIYGIHTTLILKGRKNLLSITSPEWLALIGKNHPENKLWTDVEYRENSCYLFKEEDNEYIYVTDLCRDDEELKIVKKSLAPYITGKREAGKSVFICELVQYGGEWWQCGMLIQNKLDQKIEEYISN